MNGEIETLRDQLAESKRRLDAVKAHPMRCGDAELGAEWAVIVALVNLGQRLWRERDAQRDARRGLSARAFGAQSFHGGAR